MSRIPALLGAAALFISVSAFAQTATSPSDSAAPTASAPASSDMSGDTAKTKHHMHHANKSAENKSTDWTADKLNACMAFANPSSSQETCLKQASHS